VVTTAVGEATPLSPDQLRAAISPGDLPASTEAVTPIERVFGQQRALEAITFGLGIQADGFNVVISGPSASGRSSAAMLLVSEAAATRPPAADWCYVHNFSDPHRPRAIALPPGTGDDLQRDMGRLVEACRTEIPRSFDSDGYQERARALVAPIDRSREQLLESLSRAASGLGFAVTMTPAGFMAVPLGREGRPLAPEVVASLPEADREALNRRGEAVADVIAETTRQLRQLDAQAREVIAQLDREVVRFVTGGLLQEIRERYPHEGLASHFDAVEKDIDQNTPQFKGFAESQLARFPPQLVAEMTEARERLLRRYAVNLFVTHGEAPQPSAPVVLERSPTYRNLFGRTAHSVRFGSVTADFFDLRAGSLHRANGGYLVVHLDDLVQDPLAWAKLKRSLKSREVRIEDPGDFGLPVPVVSVAPEPIPLSVKVVLVGRPVTVAIVDALDPEFHELFKIRAEFEPDAPRDVETVGSYAAFVRRVVDECGLPPFTGGALAEMVRYGTRLAGHQQRLSTRYGMVGDLAQEVAAVAKAAGAPHCDEGHVLEALARKTRRSSLVSDRIRRAISEGVLRVQTSGAVVGQVNGLAVYEVGGAAFGIPTRITCRVGVGRRGVVDIEREVERSGAIHSKGVLVLAGFLMGTFGRKRPLAFTASITFEQSYDEVEGDSASAAELCAILASLAGAPIRQDVAVTGSVDQFGNIQPVGGVTEKVEGFYDVCRDAGLSGSQGVVVPIQNVPHLTLRADVVEAVAAGAFHVWSAERLESVLEILSGMPVGAATDAMHPEGSLFSLVEAELERMRVHAARAGSEAAVELD
jgi:predicted ATP-dependent protease